MPHFSLNKFTQFFKTKDDQFNSSPKPESKPSNIPVRRHHSLPNSPSNSPPKQPLTKKPDKKDQPVDETIEFDHVGVAFKAAEAGNLDLLELLLDPSLPSEKAELGEYASKVMMLQTQQERAEHEMVILREQIKVLEKFLVERFVAEHHVEGLESTALSEVVKNPAFKSAIFEISVKKVRIKVPFDFLLQQIITRHSYDNNAAPTALERYLVEALVEQHENDKQLLNSIERTLTFLSVLTGQTEKKQGQATNVFIDVAQLLQYGELDELHLSFLGDKLSVPIKPLLQQFMDTEHKGRVRLNILAKFILKEVLASQKKNLKHIATIRKLLNEQLSFAKKADEELCFADLLNVRMLADATIDLSVLGKKVALSLSYFAKEQPDELAANTPTLAQEQKLVQNLQNCIVKAEKEKLASYRDLIDARVPFPPVQSARPSGAQRKLNFNSMSDNELDFKARIKIALQNSLVPLKKDFQEYFANAINSYVENHAFPANRDKLIQGVKTSSTDEFERVVKDIIKRFHKKLENEVRPQLKADIEKKIVNKVTADFKAQVIKEVADEFIGELKAPFPILVHKALSEELIFALMESLADQLEEMRPGFLFTIDDTSFAPVLLNRLKKQMRCAELNAEFYIGSKMPLNNKITSLQDRLKKRREHKADVLLAELLKCSGFLLRQYGVSEANLPRLKEEIINADVPVDIKDAEGRTLLDYAMRNWHLKTAKFLMDHEMAPRAFSQAWLERVHTGTTFGIDKMQIFKDLIQFAEQNSSSTFRHRVKRIVSGHLDGLLHAPAFTRKQLEEKQRILQEFNFVIKGTEGNLGDDCLAAYLKNVLESGRKTLLNFDDLNNFYDSLSSELANYHNQAGFGYVAERLLNQFLTRFAPEPSTAPGAAKVDTDFEVKRSERSGDWKRNNKREESDATLLRASTMTFVGSYAPKQERKQFLLESCASSTLKASNLNQYRPVTPVPAR